VQGELARVGPNTLLTSDPDLLQRMSSARSGYTRSEWYSGQKLEVEHDNVLSTLDDRLHATRRAKVAMGVSITPPSQLVSVLRNLVFRKGYRRSGGYRRSAFTNLPGSYKD
jgi:hypothetical protein